MAHQVSALEINAMRHEKVYLEKPKVGENEAMNETVRIRRQLLQHLIKHFARVKEGRKLILLQIGDGFGQDADAGFIRRHGRVAADAMSRELDV